MSRAEGLLDVPSAREDEGIEVYRVAYFYPYSWKEAFDRARVTGRTYAIHHWAGLWGESDTRTTVRSLLGRLGAPGWLRRFSELVLDAAEEGPIKVHWPDFTCALAPEVDHKSFTISPEGISPGESRYGG